MENIHSMKFSKSLDNLNENIPNFSFWELGSFFLEVSYFASQVAFTSVLHDNAGWEWKYHRDFVDSSKKASL